MPNKLINDLSGKSFGRWSVIRRHPHDGRAVKYQCVCSCGTKKVVYSGSLVNGDSASCGCLNLELSKKRFLKHGHALHSGGSREYIVWIGIKARCYNKNSQDYKNYGGRGIKMCKRWLNSFQHFLDDMGERPSGNYSIDRIRVNGNYSPSNCRWATKAEQSRNRRSSRWISYAGRRMVLADWCRLFKISNSNFYRMMEKKRKFSIVFKYYKEKNGFM